MTAKQLPGTQAQDVEAETQNEIDEILGEVEQLRRELNVDPGEAGTPPATQQKVAAPGASAEHSTNKKEGKAIPTEEPSTMEYDDSETGMETVLGELKQDPLVKTLFDQTFAEAGLAQPEASESDAAQVPGTTPSLALTLTGDITLKLRHERGGQEMTLVFSDRYLKLELADGTEFKIPVDRKPALRRVA